jgi:hypothetical protein
MSESVKFTEEEVKSIKEVRETYFAIQNTIGQLGVSRIRLNQESEALDNAEDNLKSTYIENQQKEKSIIDEISKKYGDGQFNLETESFIPSKKDENSDK